MTRPRHDALARSGTERPPRLTGPAALSAHLVAASGPPAAWLAWISWSDGKPSDASHVMWFVTVALTTLLAGALVTPGVRRRTVAILAAAATLVTLWLWWSLEDDSGLFLIGFLMALLPVLAAAPALVTLGAWIRARFGGRQSVA